MFILHILYYNNIVSSSVAVLNLFFILKYFIHEKLIPWKVFCTCQLTNSRRCSGFQSESQEILTDILPQ